MTGIFTITFEGETLRRGFWLYVFDITTPEERLLYVGRTGDSSSPFAQSLFSRLGRNLGTQENASMVRNHLRKRGVDPVDCRFRLVGYGPVLEEVPGGTMSEHTPSRNKVAAIEKQLAYDLKAGGYEVVNDVKSNAPLDDTLYAPLRQAFASEFPDIRAQPTRGTKD